MGRILAIDHGNKRCGLAVTDPLQLSVNPLGTVHTRQVIERLRTEVEKGDIERFVVGAPSSDDASPSSHSKPAEDFSKHLGRVFPAIPVEQVDESFTSREAVNIMLRSGVKKKDRQKKERVDLLSACLILERYLGIEAEH
jgi:putative Holliday junction resolvase